MKERELTHEVMRLEKRKKLLMMKKITSVLTIATAVTAAVTVFFKENGQILQFITALAAAATLICRSVEQQKVVELDKIRQFQAKMADLNQYCEQLDIHCSRVHAMISSKGAISDADFAEVNNAIAGINGPSDDDIEDVLVGVRQEVEIKSRVDASFKATIIFLAVTEIAELMKNPPTPLQIRRDQDIYIHVAGEHVGGILNLGGNIIGSAIGAGEPVGDASNPVVQTVIPKQRKSSAAKRKLEEVKDEK